MITRGRATACAPSIHVRVQMTSTTGSMRSLLCARTSESTGPHTRVDLTKTNVAETPSTPKTASLTCSRGLPRTAQKRRASLRATIRRQARVQMRYVIQSSSQMCPSSWAGPWPASPLDRKSRTPPMTLADSSGSTKCRPQTSSGRGSTKEGVQTSRPCSASPWISTFSSTSSRMTWRVCLETSCPGTRIGQPGGYGMTKALEMKVRPALIPAFSSSILTRLPSHIAGTRPRPSLAGLMHTRSGVSPWNL
mmetsp:Transcript_87400/g.255591  ORF Transcript_87400/g.255591 Transcript_87400/m.255591 type:complete len:250 (+) Transcript_87400:807-1556(+)